MDVYDTPATQTTTLELDAPGATRNAVDLSLFDGRLTIAVTIPSVPSSSIVPRTAIAPTSTADSDSMSASSLSDSESTVTTTPTGTDAVFVVADAPLNASSGRLYHRRERAGGRLSRTVQVPAGTKAEDLRASVTDGVLKITFPMSSAHQPEKIAVN